MDEYSTILELILTPSEHGLAPVVVDMTILITYLMNNSLNYPTNIERRIVGHSYWSHDCTTIDHVWLPLFPVWDISKGVVKTHPLTNEDSCNTPSIVSS